MEVHPLCIILVKSDSKGDRLLFRYPYETEQPSDIHDHKNGKKNPYSLSVVEDLLQSPMPQTSNIHKGQLTGFTDEVLSTLFAVKPELCNRKFELKVNDVRFVGHPTLLPFRANKDDGTSSTILVNIVFALQALASHSIVKCYYDLSKRLGKALRYEEKRCAFLSEEMKFMIGIHEEISSMDSDNENTNGTSESPPPPDNPPRSPFYHILQKSSLANSLKQVFEDLTCTGIVQARINDWVLISFCLPHKAHQFHNRGLIIEPETIDRCLRSLRSYHGILLLVDPNELLDSIPLDSSPSLIRLIMQYSPLKSLQTLAMETDLPLQQVFQLTGHLVYWAKATIIYPLCESNVYVIAPDAQVHLHSPLVEKFAQDFPGLCLIQVMSMLSLPAPFWYPARTWSGGAALLARCIVWMLQRHLLLQLHTYIQFLPTAHGPPHNGTKEYYCEKHNGRRSTLSDSTVSLNIPQTSATTPSSENSGDESLVICRTNNQEWIFPSNVYKIYDRDFARKEENGVAKNAEKPSAVDKTKVDNAKNVFRESNLIFGEMDSASDSPAASYDRDSDFDGIQFSVGNHNGHNNNNNNTIEVEIKNDTQNGYKNGVSPSENGHDLVGNHKNMLNHAKSDGAAEGVIPYNDNDRRGSITFVKIANGSNGDLKHDESMTTNGVKNGEKEKLTLNTSNSSSGSIASEKKNNSVNGLQLTTVASNPNNFNSCDVVDAGLKSSNPSISNNGSTEPINEETLLADFTEEEKSALFKIPAAHNPEDLHLMATLFKKGYFRGEQHLEEIMFMENLTRSQVLQLLDKFRDVLITYETEDPAIAMLYSSN